MNIATRWPHDNKEWPRYNRDYRDGEPGGGYPCLGGRILGTDFCFMLWFGAASSAVFRLGIAQVANIKIL
jgi:hypothetical protein